MVTAMRRRQAKDQRLTATPNIAHDRGLPWRTLVLVSSLVFAQPSPTLLHAQAFSDSFDGYTLPTSLDATANWSASPVISVLNSSGSNNYANVPVGAANPSVFMKPWVQYSGTYDKAHWPLGRTGGDFLRVEFDAASPTPAPTGRMVVMFDSKPANLAALDNNLGFNDYGPLVAVEFVATNGTPSFYANVWAQAAPGGSAGVQGINLGTLSSTYRRFRIDFAWDYFILPHDFGFHSSSYGNQPSLGEPWFYVRISCFDTSTGTWIQPYSRTSHADGATDGWVELGDETMNGVGGGSGGKISGKTSIDRYDWITGSWGNPFPPTYDPAYMYWYFDRNGSGSMTWQIDNVSIKQVDLPLFSIMTNQVGYDTSGPQWAVVRVNDSSLLDDPSLVSSIDWSLTGNGILMQSGLGSHPTADPCFMEPIDPERLEALSGDQGSKFDLGQVYWWRWEWAPIQVPATHCVVRATIHSHNHADQTVVSDPFDVTPSLAYSTLITNPANNLAGANANQRYASTSGHTSVAGGWYDANAENGENRAIACFVSALSHVLRHRRSELATVDIINPLTGTGLFTQIKNGADFLTSEGAAENTWAQNTLHPRSHAVINPPSDGAHDFDSTNSYFPTEMVGHIWHESHVRENGAPPYGMDANDDNNSDNSEWNSCMGLLDAARTLQPYGDPSAATYATQAANTRTYMEGLPGATGHPGALDFYYSKRGRAMLDFAYSEYDPTQGTFAQAVDEIKTDVNNVAKLIPTNVDFVHRFWIQGGQFNVNKSNLDNDTGDFDPAVYCPAEPILYALEHNVANPPYPNIAWWQALNGIIDQWYDSTDVMRPGTLHPNPLRITNNWTPSISLEEYYGGRPWKTKVVGIEGYAVARFAQFLGRADPRFDRLIQLATGDLNYLLGMNIGLRSRHVVQATGVAATDLQRAGASLITNVGSRWAQQTVSPLEYHIWSVATTASGQGGVQEPTTGTIANWLVAPFEYSRGLAGNGAETFIKIDANVILLVETLDRALHPKLVVEAEAGSSSAPLNITSNNVAPYLNGGMSVINLGSGTSITYSSLMQPEPPVPPWHNFHYRVRLRASNTGSVPCPVSISVTQGTYNWSDSFTVPVTAHQHDYVVVDNPIGFYSSSPLTLLTGVGFSVVLSIGGSGFGPCAFDDFVLESEGIPR